MSGPGDDPRPAGDPPVLDLRGVRKRFGAVVALDGVDFTAHAGEIHALLGENGAGKSTLMQVASGLYTADAGELRLLGRDAAGAPPSRRGGRASRWCTSTSCWCRR